MTHAMTFTSAAPAQQGRPARRIRTVLAANAATSLLAGVAGLVAAGWWADTLGIPSEGWIRVVSAALVVFAIDVALVAQRATDRLAAATIAISAADLAWVAGTVVVLAVVDLTATGTVVAVASGLAVLAFAVVQLRLRAGL